VSSGYKVLVLFHLVCVVAGFGGLAYNGLYLLLSRRRAGATAVLEINRLVSALAELLIYAAFLFGIAAVGASQSHIKFSQAWVSAAFGLFLAIVAVLHGWIRPNQHRYDLLVAELVAAPAGAAATADVARLAPLERRIAAGWGVFNVVVIVIIYLMVFKPGS
jgi:uncharacterized membrane protein